MKKLIVAMALAATANAFASFSYQGALKNADGTSVADRNKTIVFRIYESPDEKATPLWVGQQSVTISPTNGLFNVEIGDTMPKLEDEMPDRKLINAVIATSSDLYLGLEVVGANGEIRPRQRILPVPTACFARNVTQATDNFTVNGGLVVNGTATVESSVAFESDVKVSGKLTSSDGKTEILPVPVGGIIMWTQAQLPDSTHWAVCDGNQGKQINGLTIPDLRGRFVVGVNNGSARNTSLSTYNSGDTQGEEKHALTTIEMPSHYHLHFGDDHLDYRATVDHRQGGYDADSDDSGNSGWFRTTSTGGDPTKSNATAPHENRPPYYALYYIMRVK